MVTDVRPAVRKGQGIPTAPWQTEADFSHTALVPRLHPLPPSASRPPRLQTSIPLLKHLGLGYAVKNSRLILILENKEWAGQETLDSRHKGTCCVLPPSPGPQLTIIPRVIPNS